MEKNDKSNLQKMYDYQEVAGKGYYDYVVRGLKWFATMEVAHVC